MAATSYSKGYPIYYDGNNWRYKDTNEIDNNDRPCKRCGHHPTKEDYDHCLGYIPGAKNACCGHGSKNRYISFFIEFPWRMI